ncbi:hypothetical protein J5X84_22705 [Streptosporangiaceae bacterium NEAU-GS5]|nr:hypothetical protein [Streptosporangiaceae bacterium NEAU-GS5]
MNRNTLDIVVPMLYAAVVVFMWIVVKGTAATAVSAVGAILVGMYYAGIRRNIKPRQ